MKESGLIVAMFVASLLLASPSPAAAQAPSGLWDAVIVANNVEVPFRYEIAVNGTNAEGAFFEGDRKVRSTSGTFDRGHLVIEYDFLNTVLEADVGGSDLRGTYRNKAPNARAQVVRARRFTPVPAVTAELPKVEGSWAMYRTGDNRFKLDVSWRLYLRESGAEVSGAILRTSGDTGMLTGRWTDGRLVMSHFAGERPLLFEATPNADGTLTITLDKTSTFRAARTAQIREQGIPEPPDLTRFTSVKDPTERFHFSGLDLSGRPISDADARFQGKVVVLALGGTWCPNCHDEAPSLVELDRAYRDKGLEVVGLFFESNPDLAVARPRINAFIRRYGVAFPILVAGGRDEGPAKLPQLNNFSVYPTTVFIGRDGRVQSVHAGYASEATGEEHERLTQEQRQTVERLLAEPAGSRQSAER
jgi:thiol-disulfide isomerase/thioredoxin